MPTTNSTALPEEQADAILYENTAQLRRLFIGADINSPLIVYRNNRVMLSYYQTPEKEAADIRTIAKLAGKLQSVLSYTENRARETVEELTRLLTAATAGSEYNLQFFVGGNDVTRNKLVEVYGLDLRNYRGNWDAGHSCMNHTHKNSLRHQNANGDNIYPCMAYNHHSITLAVLTDAQGDIVGRSITATKSKRFYSTYCKSADIRDIMPVMLESAGFEQNGDALANCYLTTVINNDDVPLMPYLDGNYDNADFPDSDELSEGAAVAITDSTGYTCQHSDGTPENYSNESSCDDCGNRTDEDDLTNVGDTCVCDRCLSNYTYAYTRRHQEWIHCSNETIYEYDGEYYTSDALEYHNLAWDHNGEVYPQDELIADSDGDYHHIDSCTFCAITGEITPDCDIKTVSGLPLSLAAIESHTTDGKLDAIRDYIYNTGEPTQEQAEQLVSELCHSDYDVEFNELSAFHSAMLAQYQADCEQYCITQQLQLDLAA